MRIAILGPGAVGGFLAALFWKNKIPVRCIAKPDRVKAIRESGIKVLSATLGDFTAWPEAMEKLSEPVDLIFITVKSIFIAEALEKIDPAAAKNAVIVPLLNGLAHIDVLKSRYGKNAIAGTIGALEVFEEQPGAIKHLSQGGKIEIASDDLEIKSKLKAIAELVRTIGLEAEIFSTEAEVTWRKLVRLNAIACVTAATGKPIGVLRNDPVWRKKIQGAVAEASAVARLEGVSINAEDVMAQIDKVPGGQLSSLQRDVAQGRPSELEAIPGAILKKCSGYGVACPAIGELYALIKARA